MNHKTIGRQVASDDNADKIQSNCQYQRAVQTESGKLESYEHTRQDADVKETVQCRQ